MRRWTTDLEAAAEQVKREYVHKIMDILGAEDINQSELARRSGISENQVSVALNKTHNPTLFTLCRLAGALGYKVRIQLEKNNDIQ